MDDELTYLFREQDRLTRQMEQWSKLLDRKTCAVHQVLVHKRKIEEIEDRIIVLVGQQGDVRG